jgi:hypothetical protein
VRKKILFVSYSVYGGGAEKRTLAILRALDRERFEPELCVFSSAPGDRERLPPGVPLHDLSTALRPACCAARGRTACFPRFGASTS